MSKPLVNPDLATLWRANSVVSGKARHFATGNVKAPLSIKTVRNGQAVWKVGNREFTVNPDCFLVVNEGQEYELIMASGELVETRCFFFAPGYVEQACAARSSPERFLEQTSLRPIEMPNRLETMTSGLAGIAAKRPHEADEDCFAALAEGLVDLHAETQAEPTRLDLVRVSTREELLRRLAVSRDYMLSSLKSGPTLEQAAARADLSPFHFHRLFRSAFGLTPHEFLTNARIARAERLLKGTDRTLVSICLELGFESESSFCRLFRRHRGTTPGVFRKSQDRTIRLR